MFYFVLFLWHMLCVVQKQCNDMMASSNGNTFRVTDHLCGEFTAHRWIPLTKASDAELWCFLWSAPWINGWINSREAGDLRRYRTHYDVIVMKLDADCAGNCRDNSRKWRPYGVSFVGTKSDSLQCYCMQYRLIIDKAVSTRFRLSKITGDIRISECINYQVSDIGWCPDFIRYPPLCSGPPCPALSCWPDGSHRLDKYFVSVHVYILGVSPVP